MKKIVTGIGMIVFVAAIVAGGTGAFFSDTETSTGNVFTAGAIDLKIDSVSHYNGMVCTLVGQSYVWIPEANVTLSTTSQPVVDVSMNEVTEWNAFNLANPTQYPQAGVACTGTWPLSDLGGENEVAVGTFFDFDDIKPGDEGENTVSIHIDSNDAWMCVDLTNVGGSDPAETQTEPEVASPDLTTGNTVAASELDENLHFFAWRDDGDNVYEVGEVAFGAPVAASTLANQTWALADSSTGNGPIEGGLTQYIGVYWCAGTISVVGNSLSCDGEAMGNNAQTDSWFADLNFTVEQSRNNENFLCNPEVVVPETATVNVDKEIAFTDLAIEGVTVSDFTLTIDGPGDAMVVVDNVPTAGLPVGTYTISEVYSGVPANVTFNASFSGGCTEVGDTGVGTMNVVAGVNPTCVITNSVSLVEEPIN